MWSGDEVDPNRREKAEPMDQCRSLKAKVKHELICLSFSRISNMNGSVAQNYLLLEGINVPRIILKAVEHISGPRGL